VPVRIFRSPFPDVTIPDVSLSAFVLGNAGVHGDHPAFVEASSGRIVSYRTFLDRVRRLAAGLAHAGISKGDVVALWAPNSPEFAVVFHAVIRAGAILSPVNSSYTAEEAGFQLQDAAPRMLFTVAPLLERAAAAVALSQRAIDIVTIDGAAGGPSLESLCVDGAPPDVLIDPARDVVVMPYSSGTTGLPKGVMLSHRNLVANLRQIDSIEEPDLGVFLGLLPFFHIYGMVVIMNLALMRGATSVTLARFDLETVLQVLQDFPVRLAHLVPPVVVALAKHPLVANYDLSRVEWLFSGAAPLGAELTEAVEHRLSLKVRQGYGMTEASPATHYIAAGRERAGKAGQVMPSTECRIVDPETGEDQAAGGSGEIWVRGPQVMLGYLNNPEATAQTVDPDGWLHTGDIGVMDEDGYLEVVDRLKELIKVKSFQVPPAELEALLLKHPAIADAAVIPCPDDECGEVPKAVVVARAPITADEVKAFVESHVAHYKRIRHVAFVEQIPKSPSGKILRRVLVAADRESGRGARR
jgi:acyl-CoA synthetase (AMP-forming)/AMP-acid ligase II